MSKKDTHYPSVSPSPQLALRLEDLGSRLAEDQLLAELAQAAEPPMVSTRSQDRHPENVDSKQLKGAPSIAGSRKRKFEKEKESIDGDGHISVGGGKFGKLIPEEPAQDEESKNEGSRGPPMPNGLKTGSAKHKRFASEEAEEEIPLEPSEPIVTAKEEQLEDEGDSDDDAPEAITVEAGFEASRAAAVDAARIAERQQNALRAKRRDFDSRLKEQAEAVKSRRQAKNSKKTNATLPLLLPDELLTTELVTRPPTPPPSTDKSLIIIKKSKVLDDSSKRLKDIKRGSKTIRLLQNENSNLPPKSSATSKAIRERWLMGQRGSLGGVGVPRRKANTGFIRR